MESCYGRRGQTANDNAQLIPRGECAWPGSKRIRTMYVLSITGWEDRKHRDGRGAIITRRARLHVHEESRPVFSRNASL